MVSIIRTFSEHYPLDPMTFMPVVSKNGNDPTLESVLNHAICS